MTSPQSRLCWGFSGSTFESKRGVAKLAEHAAPNNELFLAEIFGAKSKKIGWPLFGGGSILCSKKSANMLSNDSLAWLVGT